MNRAKLIPALVLGMIIGFISWLHFMLPIDSHRAHVLHVVLACLYLLPVIWSAISFGFRRGLLVSTAISVIYLAHIGFSWAGQPMENVNQFAMIAVYLTVGLTSGLLVSLRDKERERRLESERTSQRRAIVQGLAGLSNALGFRDEYTRRHSEEVAQLAVEIGRRRGLSEEKIETLRLAALIHDIGKIGVRDDILYKPERLGPEERAAMARHPMLAAEILQPIQGAEEIAAIVLAHHERPDGSGYPRGLRGCEIPLEALILSVADVYSALTEGRPYKSAMTEQEAIRIIRAMAGQKLDEKAVESLIEWIDDKNKQRLPEPQFQFGGPPDPGNGREMALLGGRTGPWANVPGFLRRNTGPRASN